MSNKKCVAEETGRPFTPSKAEWFIFNYLNSTQNANEQNKFLKSK